MGGRVGWAEAVGAFVDRMRADNCSASTIETYRCLLLGGRAKRFREAHDIAMPSQFTVDVFEALKREFLADGLKPATVDDYCRVWRTFAKFCYERGLGVDASVLQVRGPRQPSHVPSTFTTDDEARLIATARCARDRLLIQLILETGLRRSEVANLTVDDVLDAGQSWLIRVRQGKGRKDRGVPLSDDFAEQLLRWIDKRPLTKSRALFLTGAKVNQGDYGGLTSNGIYQIWRRLSQATGIRAYPHKGRHTAATRWAQDNLAPWAIQRALGHSSLAMTNRYVDAAAVDLVDAFRRRRNRIAG